MYNTIKIDKSSLFFNEIDKYLEQKTFLFMIPIYFISLISETIKIFKYDKKNIRDNISIFFITATIISINLGIKIL